MQERWERGLAAERERQDEALWFTVDGAVHELERGRRADFFARFTTTTTSWSK
jgi:hypothetical protein